MQQNPILKQKPKRYYSADRVRRSLVHYLLGRGTASLASFATAILLIRIFPVNTYALYTAFSGLLVFIGMASTGGIDRVVPRFLPELKQVGADRTMRSYIIWLSGLRMFFTLCILLPLLLFSDSIAGFLKFTGAAGPSVLFSFSAFVLARTMSAQFSLVLQSLLHQREATIGNIIEFVTRLAVILIGYLYFDRMALDTVYWIFFVSSGLGCTYLCVQVYRYTGKMDAVKDRQEVDRIPLQRLLQVGWNNYLYRFLGFPTTTQASKILAASFLASFQTAILGFSCTIIDVMVRYLPASLLLGLIEPVFMARYSEDRNFENLNQMAQIVLKINLFLIAPAAAWMAFAGSPVLGVISVGKYTDAALTIVALMVWVMIYSQQLVLQLILNAIEETHLLVSSNLRVLLFLPVYLGLILGLGLTGLLSGIILLPTIRNYYIVSKMRNLGYPYKLDWPRLKRIIISAICSAGLVAWFFDFEIRELTDSLVAGIGTFGIYLIFLYFWKAFATSERDLLNRFAGRKVFIW